MHPTLIFAPGTNQNPEKLMAWWVSDHHQRRLYHIRGRRQARYDALWWSSQGHKGSTGMPCLLMLQLYTRKYLIFVHMYILYHIYIIRYTNYKYNVQYIMLYIYIHTTRMLQLHRRHGNLPRLCSLGAGRFHLKQLTGVPHVCPPTILLTWVIYGEIYWNLCWNMVKYGDIW